MAGPSLASPSLKQTERGSWLQVHGRKSHFRRGVLPPAAAAAGDEAEKSDDDQDDHHDDDGDCHAAEGVPCHRHAQLAVIVPRLHLQEELRVFKTLGVEDFNSCAACMRVW